MIFLALVVSALLAACSCSQKTGMETGAVASYEEINRMANTWNHHNATGHQDSIIIDTRPFLAKVMEKRDTVSAQYSLAFMAQAWLLLENRDSLDRYLALFEQWKTPELLPQIGIIYSNVLGHYALKFRLDYVQALSHYLDVYDYAKAVDNIQNEITTLYNIVSIYNIRADATGGLPYAREALILSEDDDTDPFHKVAANMAMSYSLLGPGTSDSAQYYLTLANMIVIQNRLDYWLAILNLQQADILTMTGNPEDAAGHYESALAYSRNAEPSTIAEIYLKYGRLSESAGDFPKAAELYFQGIRVSKEMENLEFRLPLYKDLAEVLYKMHNNDLAAQFLRQYTILQDSLSVEQNGHEFYHSISAYNRLKSQYEIAVRDFELKEATRVLSDPSMTDVSLKQLADDVGYSSIQTFFAAFKRETGTTPGMYRKERLKNRTFTDS